MRIPVRLRQLLQYSDAQKLVRNLSQFKSEENEIVYLPSTNKLIQSGYGEYFKGSKKIPDDFEESQFLVIDDQVLSELKMMGCIGEYKLFINNYEHEEFEYEDWVVRIDSVNRECIINLLSWFRTIKHEINYGIFSLNTLTGKAYCDDYSHNFNNTRARYSIFKKFLSYENHTVSFKEMRNLKQSKNESTNPTDREIRALHKYIQHMKRELGMTKSNGRTKLFVLQGKMGYRLLPNL